MRHVDDPHRQVEQHDKDERVKEGGEDEVEDASVPCVVLDNDPHC